MSQDHDRITGRDDPPDDGEIAGWIGNEAFGYWKRTMEWIEWSYPDVFVPEWIYGGKKHGWSLRFKRSKSFCTLIPEKGRFALLIVFGAEERKKVEAIREGLSPHAREEYDKAETYHDGKWLLLAIDSEKALQDAFSLLTVKRKPKRMNI